MKTTYLLKYFRDNRNVSQQDIANKLGIARQTYISYENNILNCDLSNVCKILDILNLNQEEIDDFFNALKQDYMSVKNN